MPENKRNADINIITKPSQPHRKNKIIQPLFHHRHSLSDHSSPVSMQINESPTIEKNRHTPNLHNGKKVLPVNTLNIFSKYYVDIPNSGSDPEKEGESGNVPLRKPHSRFWQANPKKYV